MPSIVFTLLFDLHGRLLNPSLKSENCQQCLACVWSVSIVWIALDCSRLSLLCEPARPRQISSPLDSCTTVWCTLSRPIFIECLWKRSNRCHRVLRAKGVFVSAFFRTFFFFFLSTSLQKKWLVFCLSLSSFCTPVSCPKWLCHHWLDLKVCYRAIFPQLYCRKTPLISTYVFSGLTMVQVLIFGAVLTFGGYDKAEAKILQGRSLLNLVLSVDNALLCMFQRVWT